MTAIKITGSHQWSLSEFVSQKCLQALDSLAYPACEAFAMSSDTGGKIKVWLPGLLLSSYMMIFRVPCFITG